jgi:type I restriction enzyme R subunit
MVAAKMPLIKEVQTNPYWQTVSLAKFEHLRKELRLLVRFIEREYGKTFFSNFTDLILEDPAVPMPVVINTSLDAYKKRVTEFVQKNRSHITIHKLRTNQPITSHEIRELENMLFSQGELGTREQFEKVYGDQPLGWFIRSIVGLDVAAANQAFGQFINNPSLNSSQIRFLNLIIQYLTNNGVITAEKLFEPPFTDISTNGLLGVFNDTSAREVIDILEDIGNKAKAI